MGTGALLTIILIATQLRFALLAFAAAVLALVIAGFCVPTRSSFLLYLPAVSDLDVGDLPVGIHPQPYPQLFVFRAEVRKLAALLIAPIYSLSVAAWAIAHPGITLNDVLEQNTFGLGPLLTRGAAIVSSLAVLMAWHWLSERILLLRSAVRLGLLHSTMGDGQLSYEYFDTEGERQGGTANPFGRIDSVMTPVFVNEKNGEYSKPGFGFLFHKFAVSDSCHLPSQEVDSSKRDPAPP